MDDNLFQVLANEALFYARLDELERKRAELEAVPAPEARKGGFSSWREALEARCRSEIEASARSVVGLAVRQMVSGGIWDEAKLAEDALKLWDKELLKVARPVVLLAYLPHLEAALDGALTERAMAEWNLRTRSVDDELILWRRQARPSFSPELINVDERFPIDRIQWVDGKAHDRWLTEGLGLRKPIPFDPHDKWVEGMIRFYREVYLPRYEQEKSVEEPVEQKHPADEEDSEESVSVQSGGLPPNWRQVMGWEREDTFDFPGATKFIHKRRQEDD